jgi:hypothetical protein
MKDKTRDSVLQVHELGQGPEQLPQNCGPDSQQRMLKYKGIVATCLVLIDVHKGKVSNLKQSDNLGA